MNDLQIFTVIIIYISSILISVSFIHLYHRIKKFPDYTRLTIIDFLIFTIPVVNSVVAVFSVWYVLDEILRKKVK